MLVKQVVRCSVVVRTHQVTDLERCRGTVHLEVPGTLYTDLGRLARVRAIDGDAEELGREVRLRAVQVARDIGKRVRVPCVVDLLVHHVTDLDFFRRIDWHTDDARRPSDAIYVCHNALR